MSKKKKKRKAGQQAPPSPQDQRKMAAIKQKKEFIKGLMQAQSMVVFTPGQNFSFFGIPNERLLEFLLREVYGWDGRNVMFQKILAKLEGPAQPAPDPATKELDDMLEEVAGELDEDDVEDATGGAEDDEEDGDDSGDEEDEEDAESPSEPPAKVLPIDPKQAPLPKPVKPAGNGDAHPSPQEEIARLEAALAEYKKQAAEGTQDPAAE